MKNDRTCTGCGQPFGRSDLVVKRVTFATMGKGYRNLFSRTVAWLCPDCRDKDKDWHRKPHADAPGHQ